MDSKKKLIYTVSRLVVDRGRVSGLSNMSKGSQKVQISTDKTSLIHGEIEYSMGTTVNTTELYIQ